MTAAEGNLLLEAQDVSYRYPDGSAGLDVCTLAIASGTRNALLGANGAGKTTLLQHCNGLLRPAAGAVRVHGTPLDYGRRGLHALRREVGMVFQNPDRQLFSASVIEDVSFGPLNLGLDEATVRARVAEALEAVGMTALARKPVHQLSFGQKKRVCIAGVLAMRPRLLLLDEPMAGLDAGMQQELAALLDGLVVDGMTVLLSTHDVDFAYGWADAIHLLRAGRCVASVPAAELPHHAEALQAAGQPLPQAAQWQAALARRGLLPAAPPVRSMAALLGAVQALPDAFFLHSQPQGGPA